MGSIGDTQRDSLDPSECWGLLRAETIGRLAVVLDGRPEIFPLNYVTDHGTVVFRSDVGAKLSGVAGRACAAFEIDGVNRDDRTAWSVVIHGRLEPLVSFDPLTTDVLPLYPLHAGAKPRFVRVVPDAISGRRFHTVEPSQWLTPAPLGRPQPWE